MTKAKTANDLWEDFAKDCEVPSTDRKENWFFSYVGWLECRVLDLEKENRALRAEITAGEHDRNPHDTFLDQADRRSDLERGA